MTTPVVEHMDYVEHLAHDRGISLRAPPRLFEFQAFALPLRISGAELLPDSPGAALFDATGHANVMYVGPGRWLLRDPEDSLVALLDIAVAAGAGMLTPARDKWRLIELAGPEARKSLCAAVDVDSLLLGRQCAAVALHDCPAIVANRAGGFDVWVGASYAAALLEMLERS